MSRVLTEHVPDPPRMREALAHLDTATFIRAHNLVLLGPPDADKT